MKRTILIILAITLTFCLTACGCQHEWKEATCTTPKTCTLCQEIEGEALGHKWKTATCTTPKTCELCAETVGKEMGHDYKEEKVVDYVTATSTISQTCSRCKDRSESTTSLSTLHDGEYFFMSPTEFSTRWANTMVALVEDIRSDNVDFRAEYLCFIDEEPEEPIVRIYVTKRLDGDDNKITVVGSIDPIKYDNYTVLYRNKDIGEEILCFRGPILKEDASFVMLSLIQTLDPTADNTAAWELYEKWAQTGYVKSNGLVYTLLAGKEPNTVNLSIYIG